MNLLDGTGNNSDCCCCFLSTVDSSQYNINSLHSSSIQKHFEPLIHDESHLLFHETTRAESASDALHSRSLCGGGYPIGHEFFAAGVHSQLPSTSEARLVITRQTNELHNLETPSSSDRLLKLKNVRRPTWTCPECKQRFDDSDQFYAHFEPCWVANVEKEHLRHLSKSYSNNEKRVSLNIYRLGNVNAEIPFDGTPSLISSKSGRIPLFISLESETVATTNPSLGNATKRIEIAEHYVAQENTGTNRRESIQDAHKEGRINLNNGIDMMRNPAELPDVSRNSEILDASIAPPKKVECPVCGQLLYRHNLSVHHRIHTGELPFACAFCPKKFRTSSARKVHHRSHTGEKPYICRFCEYTCITKRNLERHIHNRHLPVRAFLRGKQRKSQSSRKIKVEMLDEDDDSSSILTDCYFSDDCLILNA